MAKGDASDEVEGPTSITNGQATAFMFVKLSKQEAQLFKKTGVMASFVLASDEERELLEGKSVCSKGFTLRVRKSESGSSS